MKPTTRTTSLTGVLMLALLAGTHAFAITTNFFADFQGSAGGGITSAAVLNGGTAVGTWGFLGLPGSQTGAGAISVAGSGNKAAVFAHHSSGITGMTLMLATNAFTDTGSYPGTYFYDAGSGTRVVANFATPGSFTGSAQTLIGFRWGTFGTANTGQAKGQFVRGIDAAGNEVFKLLFLSGSASGNRIMYFRTASESNIVLNSSTSGTPNGTALNAGSSTTAYNSTVVGTDPTEYIQVSILLTNGQVAFTLTYSGMIGSPITSASFAVNSSATTIAALEFSEMWNAAVNASNKGFWLDDLIVSDGPLPNPKFYQWKPSASNNTWDIATTANWINLGTGLASTYTEGAVGGVTAIFDDTAATNVVNISPVVRPNVVAFSNNSTAYVMTGAGRISGTGTEVDFKGSSTVTISNANDYVGNSVLSAGRVRLANNAGLGSGLVTFSGGALSSVGSTPLSLTNSISLAAYTTLGDVADNGSITFASLINLGSGARSIEALSEVTFAAGALGTGNNGGISAKYGFATLKISGPVNIKGPFDVRDGTLILDGASLTNSDRLRPDSALSTIAARLIVTNGSVVVLNSGGNNLAVGSSASSSGTNIVDLAGLWLTPNANANNGNIYLQNLASSYSELNFLPGGDCTANLVATQGDGPYPTRLNFDGGTLRARGDNTTFLQGLTETFIRSRGAFIDDGGFSITINQDLLDGGGAGGLTKLGAGTLVLNSTNNTYTGATVISNGTLSVRLPSVSSAVGMSPNTTLSVVVGPVADAKWTLTGMTLPGTNTINFTYAADSVPPSGALATVPTLTVNQNVSIGVTGVWPMGTYTLLDYGSLGAGSAIVFKALPPGMSGYLTNNPATTAIELVVTQSVNMLYWYGGNAFGANGGLWDIGTSFNWNMPAGGSGNTTYQEYGAGPVGDYVVFDASYYPMLGVDITTTVRPAAVSVTNPSGGSYDFVFAGAGKISGAAVLTKDGAGNLTLNQANDYTGGTLLKRGTLTLGVDNALPVTGIVTLGMPNQTASLVLNGFNQTLGGLVGAGSGTGYRRLYNGTETPVTLTLNVPSGVVNAYVHTLGMAGDANANNLSVVKSGDGEQRVGVCEYTGTTLVNGGRLVFAGNAVDATNTVTVNSGGTLAGAGVIGGPVTLNTGSTLTPTSETNIINSLTISNDLSMIGAVTCRLKISKSPLTCDRVGGVGNITYSGALIVTNVSSTALAGGEVFTLFNASGTKSGNFSSVTILPSTGATGTFDPATGRLTITTPVPATPTNLTVSVSGGNIWLSWPPAYLGWSLQSQSNSLGVGLATNWVTVPGSAQVTSTNFPINPATPAAFFRMFYTVP